MSLCVAIRDGDTIYVGSDSAILQGSKKSVSKEGQSKLWKLDKYDVVFAHSGNVVVRNIISMSSKVVHKKYKKRAIRIKDVVNSIVPRIAAVLKDRGHEEIESSLILAHRNRVFQICGDGGTTEPSDDFVSIGSGSDMAVGAFQVIKDDARYNAQQKLIKVISGVCSAHYGVGYPIRVINTKNDDIVTILNEDEAIEFTSIPMSLGIASNQTTYHQSSQSFLKRMG